MMSSRLLDRLAARQNADGGWGAAQGAASSTECTALAALVYQASGAADDAARGAAAERWLLSHQGSDGAWRHDPNGVGGTWATPIALLALRDRADAARATERGYQWLVQVRGRVLPWRVRLRQFLTRTQAIELDATLPGWPWVEGSFSWVEPTSWALIALKSAWPQTAPRTVTQRIRGGEDMLLDRACPGGGWNYGNSRVLDEDLTPFPDTTALALLGLLGRASPQVAEGFQTLDRLLDEHASGLSLALGVLGLRAWRRDATGLAARLETRLEHGGLGDTRTLALGALALAPRLHWLGARAHA